MPRFSFKRTSNDASPASEPLTDESDEEAKPKSGLLKKLGGGGGKQGRQGSGTQNRPPMTQAEETKKQQTQPKRSKKLPRFSKSGKRKGAICCGFCDMRIASSLLNILHMIGAIMRELIEASKWGNRNYFHDPPVLLILAIMISGLGLVGSLRFSNSFLILSSVCLPFLCYLYVGETYLFLLAIVIMLFCAQIGLASEIARGIMNDDNYAREEYIDESGKVMYTTVTEKATELGDAACAGSKKNSTVEL